MFLLVPAHLGCHEQNSESRETVMWCVYECVCALEVLNTPKVAPNLKIVQNGDLDN